MVFKQIYECELQNISYLDILKVLNCEKEAMRCPQDGTYIYSAHNILCKSIGPRLFNVRPISCVVRNFMILAQKLGRTFLD